MKKIIFALVIILTTTNSFAYRYLFCVRQGVHVPECFTVEIQHPNFCDLGLTRSNVTCDRLNRTTDGNNTTPESLNNLRKVTYKNDSKTGKTTFYFNGQAIFYVPKAQANIYKELVNQIDVAKKSNQASNNIK